MLKERPIATDSPCVPTWTDGTPEYMRLICDYARDSHYLRERGLKPNLLYMAGDCSDARVLDIGCGDGWLLNELDPREGHACDIVHEPDLDPRWIFALNDIRELQYEKDTFDVTAASLVLMWFEELDMAVRELHRVTAPGGKVVISLVHPYFYRTGGTSENGDFTVTKDLSRPFEVPNLKIGGSAGPFSYHYRPFADYMNACTKAGLRIREVRDWFIDIEDFNEHISSGMKSDVRRTGKVPLYSFIECSKE